MNDGLWTFILITAVLGTAVITNGVSKERTVHDINYLGGFSHNDKVYSCSRIRPDKLRTPAERPPIVPDVGEGGEATE